MDSKLKLFATIESKLASLSKKSGQLVLVYDDEALYADYGTNTQILRVKITDMIDVETEDDRLALLTPNSSKYYCVLSTQKLWRYLNGQWYCLNKDTDLTVIIQDIQQLKQQLNGLSFSISKDGKNVCVTYDDGL